MADEPGISIIAVAIIVSSLIIGISIYAGADNIKSGLAGLGIATGKPATNTGTAGTGGTQAQVNNTQTQPSGPTLPDKWEDISGGTSCSAAGKPKVYIFLDPYCPACVQTSQYTNAFYRKFSSAVDISFKIVPTHSGSLIQTYGADAVLLAHKYYACADKQGKLVNYEEEFNANLKIVNGDYQPYNATQLAAMATKAGLDTAQLNGCISSADTILGSDTSLASQFGNGGYYTPMSTIDCKYVGPAYTSEAALCKIFPNTAGC